MCGGNRDQEDHEDVDFIDLEEIEAQTGNKPDPPVFDRVRSWLMPGGKLAPANVVWIVGSVLVFALVLFAAYRLLHHQSETQNLEKVRLAKIKQEQEKTDLAELQRQQTEEQDRLKPEAGEKKAEEKEAEADAELQRKPMEVEDARAVKQKEKDDQAEAERQKLQKKGLAAFRRHLQEPLVKLKEKEHATEKGTAEFRRHLQEKAGLVAKEPEKGRQEHPKKKQKRLEMMAFLEEDRNANELKEQLLREKNKKDRLAKEQEDERVRKEHFAKLKNVADVPDFNIEWDATKNELVVQLTEDTIAALKANPAYLEVQWNNENGDGEMEFFTTQEVPGGVMRIPVTKRNVKDFRNGNALRVTALADFDGSEQIESPAKNIPQAAIDYAQNR
eukprot:298344_1